MLALVHRTRIAGRALLAALGLACLASGKPGELRAQQVTGPEPEEQRAAAEAPLFSEHAALRVVLRTDLGLVREDRREDREEQPAVVVLPRGASDSIVVEAEVRPRGNFRRRARNCHFPPLRLDLKRSQTAGTPFEGEDKLKLVTPCRDGRSTYRAYVLREYLAYRILQLLTPESYRVRLFSLTYEDTREEGEDPFTVDAFVLEDEGRMADRLGGEVIEFPQLHPGLLDDDHALLVALFQYLIGNTDWSIVEQHNMDLVRTRDLRYLGIPYDFDFAGLVDARYASPMEGLGIRSVRERLFRGFCREDADWDGVVRTIRERWPDVRRLVSGLVAMDEGEREDALDYLESGFRILDDPRLLRIEVVERCRTMPD